MDRFLKWQYRWILNGIFSYKISWKQLSWKIAMLLQKRFHPTLWSPLVEKCLESCYLNVESLHSPTNGWTFVLQTELGSTCLDVGWEKPSTSNQTHQMTSDEWLTYTLRNNSIKSNLIDCFFVSSLLTFVGRMHG